LGKRGALALLNVKHHQGVSQSLTRVACWRLFQAGEELWMAMWRWHNATGKLCQAKRRFFYTYCGGKTTEI